MQQDFKIGERDLSDGSDMIGVGVGLGMATTDQATRWREGSMDYTVAEDRRAASEMPVSGRRPRKKNPTKKLLNKWRDFILDQSSLSSDCELKIRDARKKGMQARLEKRGFNPDLMVTYKEQFEGIADMRKLAVA